MIELMKSYSFEDMRKALQEMDKIDLWIDKAERLEDVYSNCDHELKSKVVEKLKTGDFTAGHPAWEFHGRIIFKEGKFFERVNRYGDPVGYYENEDIMALIKTTNEIHGND